MWRCHWTGSLLGSFPVCQLPNLFFLSSTEIWDQSIRREQSQSLTWTNQGVRGSRPSVQTLYHLWSGIIGVTLKGSLSLFTGWGNISPQSDGFMSEWIQVGNDIDFAQSFGWRISNSWFINEVLIHRSLQTVTASVYIFPYKHVDGYHSWTDGSIFHPLHSV